MLVHGAGAVKAACLTDDARAILRPLTTSDERFPFPPFPDGWYALCLSAELPAGSVRGTVAFGRRLVLYRTAEGRAAVADAFCPHLGADLSRGGRVEGDRILCPFHGLAFDGGGACRGGPYSPLPPAGLSTLATREPHGLLLAWNAADGRPPEWEVPALPTEGFTPLRAHRFRVRTHPQETTENSVDTAHLSVLHGYADVATTRPLETEGPCLRAAYRMTRHATLAGLPVTARAEFDVLVHGLGHSHVDIGLPELGLRARLLVLPTPVDGETTELCLAVAVEEPRRPRGAARPLALLPRGLAARLLRRTFLSWAAEDVAKDVSVWEAKRYLEAPGLARGDGPIAAYRRWCRQFYGEPPGETGVSQASRR